MASPKDSFLENIFSLLPEEIQEFLFVVFSTIFAKLSPYFSTNIRIFIWGIGVLTCLVFLFHLLRGKKEKLASLPDNSSFFNLLNKHNINYSLGELIRKVIAKEKLSKFLGNNAFFEKSIQQYHKNTSFTFEEEIKLMKIREKLGFTTQNNNLKFFRSQQIHSGTLLKIYIADPNYDIHFDSKLLENRESYLLVSYPQIQKEEHIIKSGKELKIEFHFQDHLYSFSSQVLPVKNENGIQLAHSDKIEKKVTNQNGEVMHIIIGGAKEIGEFLIEEFSSQVLDQDHSITVIDEDYKEIQRINQQFNVTSICGSITDIQILKQVIQKETEVFVACSPLEEANLIACTLANSLGVKNNIALTYSSIYTKKEVLQKYQNSGITKIINTNKAIKEEVSKLTDFSSSIQISHFANGKVMMYGFVVEKNFFFCNQFIREIPKTSFFLVGAVIRNNQAFIPDGNWKIQEKDHLFVLFPKQKVTQFEQQFNIVKEHKKKAIIFGNTTLVLPLLKDLTQESFTINAIALDLEQKELFQKSLKNKKNCKIHSGSISDLLLQKKIEISKEVLFLALSDNEPENLTACMLAKYLGVGKTIALVNEQEFLSPAQKMGVDVSLSKKIITIRIVHQMIHHGDIFPDFTTVANTEMVVLSLEVSQDSEWVGKNLQNIVFPNNSLVGIIISKKGKVVIPKGDSQIQKNDKMVFFTQPKNLLRLKKSAIGL